MLNMNRGPHSGISLLQPERLMLIDSTWKLKGKWRGKYSWWMYYYYIMWRTPFTFEAASFNRTDFQTRFLPVPFCTQSDFQDHKSYFIGIHFRVSKCLLSKTTLNLSAWGQRTQVEKRLAAPSVYLHSLRRSLRRYCVPALSMIIWVSLTAGVSSI
jgi:hypothetical protein